MTMTSKRSRYDRRSLIRKAAAASVAALPAAGSWIVPALAQDATPAATPGGGTPVSTRQPILPGDPIAIYDSGAVLPDEPVTLTWLENGSGPRTDFMTDLFTRYHEAHPTIQVNYEHYPIPDQNQLLSVAIQNETLPDVFQPTPTIQGNQLVAQGLVAPLDDVIPNFAEWKAAFPPNTFFEGINVYGGKTYTFPITSNQWLTNALLYNVAYMEAAGYDPATTVLSWDEFRDAAARITEAGQGQYFGLVIGGQQTNTLGELVAQLAELAGATGGEFNWQTGDFNYTHDAFANAIELLVSINRDGSVFPGSTQLSNPAARDQFPQGIAGMILQGQWNIPQWAVRTPDFAFDVGMQPLADVNSTTRLTYGPGGANARFVAANSGQQAVAGDILHFLGTREGQVAWGVHTQGSDPPIFVEARAAAASDPRMARVNALTGEWMVLAPSPAVRNPDFALVNLERRPLTPNFGEIVQGFFSGQLTDIGSAMKDLQDRANAELDNAIKAAQDKGAQVSRDDWVFPAWDPTRDFTEQDYQALT